MTIKRVVIKENVTGVCKYLQAPSPLPRRVLK
jgi:hypothetical protein